VGKLADFLEKKVPKSPAETLGVCIVCFRDNTWKYYKQPCHFDLDGSMEREAVIKTAIELGCVDSFDEIDTVAWCQFVSTETIAPAKDGSNKENSEDTVSPEGSPAAEVPSTQP